MKFWHKTQQMYLFIICHKNYRKKYITGMIRILSQQQNYENAIRKKLKQYYNVRIMFKFV